MFFGNFFVPVVVNEKSGPMENNKPDILGLDN